MHREGLDRRGSISSGRVPAGGAHRMPLHGALGPNLQGRQRRAGRYALRSGRSRPRAPRWRRNRAPQAVAQERLQRARLDPQRPRLGGRPGQGTRPRRRRLHAQAVQPRGAARAHPLAGPASIHRQADRARARRHPPRSSRAYGAGQRQAGRSHQPRVRAAGDLHAEPREDPSPHADHGQDLGLELRRRHQPARRLHEPAAREAGDDLGEAALQDRARGRISVVMRSIGTRIAAWYATAATGTLACLFVVGYLLLQKQLVHGLDLLIETEFREIDNRLGPDYRTLSPEAIETRIREITDYASTLFYIDMTGPRKGVIFRSTNLIGHDIPDVRGARNYTVEVGEIGEVRAEEFHKMPFEVTIATPLRPVRDVMDSYIKVCVLLLAAMVVVSLVIGLGLARFVLWPVRLIRDTAKKIRHDNLNQRIPVPDVHDEIADLARLLNEMFDRLETSFSQVRRFSADASHELKIPLSLIRLHAEKMLAGDALPPAHREALQIQLEEVARLTQIIDELLFLSRADANAVKLDLKAQDPNGLVQSFAQDASVLAEHHGRRFACDHHGEGSVAFDSKWMRQVLLNLLTNAIHVSPTDGLISVQSELSAGKWRVSVEDQGPGLTVEQRQRMFERFVRIVQPGKEYPGSGLGLAICRSIVTLHGGQISAAPGVGGNGLGVITEIPAAGAA